MCNTRVYLQVHKYTRLAYIIFLACLYMYAIVVIFVVSDFFVKLFKFTALHINMQKQSQYCSFECA